MSGDYLVATQGGTALHNLKDIEIDRLRAEVERLESAEKILRTDIAMMATDFHDKVERLTKERDRWEQEALQYCQNADYWRKERDALQQSRDFWKADSEHWLNRYNAVIGEGL
jgi:uncharacterized coiled-coil DUF342 family protein